MDPHGLPLDREKRLFAITKALYNGLHFRYLSHPSASARAKFADEFAKFYPTITREDAIDLLSWQAWQPRTVGASICAFRSWSDFDGCIGRLLVRDELIFASVEYSFALARFALPSSSVALCAYLWSNFSGRCTDYSSLWHAIAALKWIDEKNGTDFYERNVGEWHEKIESGRATLMGTPKEEARELMRRALSPERIESALHDLAALMQIADEWKQ